MSPRNSAVFAGPEAFAQAVADMPRQELIDTLRGLHCRFDLDFSDAYLARLSDDRLRHVLLAAGLHAAELPGSAS